MSFDVLISGGRVLDGTGAPAHRADVGVTGDRITAVGRLNGAEAAITIDAAGRHVMPGLVDCHVHGDALVLDPAVQLAALRQGVTTFVLGQDGLSYAPCATPETFAYVTRYFAAINGPHPLADGPLGVAELLAGYDRATALNTAYLLPHGTIRHDVMGAAERAATAGELTAMLARVERGLSEGAVGLSSGLEYAPGRYADAAELAALCAPLDHLPYVTHMRAYGAAAPEGMAEVADIARRSGAAVHVSHYHGPAATLLPLVDEARLRGLDVTFDTYPYLRGSTILSMLALPAWIPAADTGRALEMLDSRPVEWDETLWPRITFSHVPGAEWAEGLTLPEAAAGAGLEPGEFCRRILIDTRLEAGCVVARPDEGAGGEESVRAILRHPAHTGGSDGIYVGGHPHPRAYGAFARMLGHHVRETGDWTLEQAVVHLASHPARRFGLRDRGLVRAGQVADLAVLDAAGVADLATYAAPRTLATGVGDVLVRGVPVLAAGRLTGATPGRALRP
ncbi:N-acyl-D-amino-acid deacylase family protein [Streptosporangium sp. DT93]|uniref:N-acyl-D-amino-acid deacylase family protein n=1 Tax=Streptosporangium sp. DT93 TaxID=3393428 RepID=UPI003CFA7AEE